VVLNVNSDVRVHPDAAALWMDEKEAISLRDSRAR
jgi:hypothetical protein